MSYICLDCGHVFDDPHTYEERHGLEHGPYEYFSVCPACGSSAYDTLGTCERCGAATANIELSKVHGRWLCKECLNAVDPDCDTPFWERPPAVSSFLLNNLSTKEHDLVIAVLRHCSAIHAVNPEGCLLATYDPSEKSSAETDMEQLMIDAVLATDVVPGQWRPMVAYMLLWFINRYPHDCSDEEANSLERVASLLWPWSMLPWPTDYTRVNATTKRFAKMRIQEANEELHCRAAEDPEAVVILQVGQLVYTLPAASLNLECTDVPCANASERLTTLTDNHSHTGDPVTYHTSSTADPT